MVMVQLSMPIVGWGHIEQLLEGLIAAEGESDTGDDLHIAMAT